MHTTERYQYCIFSEDVRPLPSYTFGTKVMGQGSSAARRLQYEIFTHLALEAAGVRVSGDKQADWADWLPKFQPRRVGLLEAQGLDVYQV